MEISEYTELLHLQGYKTGDDIENLKELKDEDLRALGISKRGIIIILTYHALLDAESL